MLLTSGKIHRPSLHTRLHIDLLIFTIQELKLNNCGLGIGGGTMLANALNDCVAASERAGTPLQLKVFIAGRNRLENEGAKALANVFGKIKTLEHVAMPQNGIYYVGITALSEALKLNGNMRILNLNDNTIGSKGASALAEALESMQKYETILGTFQDTSAFDVRFMLTSQFKP